jgi:hypothetical protein
MRDTQREKQEQEAFANKINKMIDLINANLSLLLLYVLTSGLYSIYKTLF